MARGTGSSGEKRATPRGRTASDKSDNSDQRYDVSLFLKTGYVRVGGADELEDGFTSLQEAIVRANALVTDGPWVRAIVSQENDDGAGVVALYDTARDAPDARDAALRVLGRRPPREPDEEYFDNDGHLVFPTFGARLSQRAMNELKERQEDGGDSADETLDGLAPEDEEWEEEEEEEERRRKELLLELIRDGIRCIWRGGTTISVSSNSDTGDFLEEIEITEPTAKHAVTAMEAYYSANQRR